MPQPARRVPPSAGRQDVADLIDRQRERPVPLSILPSDHQHRPRITPASARRLATWLETHIPVGNPTSASGQLGTVAPVTGPAFYRARVFLKLYGARRILTNLEEMFQYVQDLPGGPHWRCWRPEIVSPARFLYYTVKQDAQLDGGNAP
jgi:hypothetical protein